MQSPDNVSKNEPSRRARPLHHMANSVSTSPHKRAGYLVLRLLDRRYPPALRVGLPEGWCLSSADQTGRYVGSNACHTMHWFGVHNLVRIQSQSRRCQVLDMPGALRQRQAGFILDLAVHKA